MPSNEPQFRFKANLLSGAGNAFVDLSGGGGANPPVIAFFNNTNTTNPNQIWEFYSVPGFETRVVVKNSGNKSVLYSAADGQNVRCDSSPSVWDASAQWYLEGGEVGDIKDGTIVRLRNVKFAASYLDLAASNTNNGTPFLVWPGHGGPNQSFKILRR
ncbi:ricin B lectin domain-containing protein [Mariannaea sp. PMI_226]|nr:ricin B lectin domain-containing protein [Mariannaea sp. PMI_226]